MKRVHINLFCLLIIATLIISCGQDTLVDQLPDFLKPDNSADSPGSSSPSVPGTDTPISAGRAVKEYSTTTGGLIKVSESQKITLNSGESFKGITSDGRNIYVLVTEYINYSDDRVTIYKIPVNSNSATVQCSNLSSAPSSNGLAYDGAYFYLVTGSWNATISKISSNSCSEISSIEMPASAYCSDSGSSFVYDSGSLYCTGLKQYEYGKRYLLKMSPSGGLLATISTLLLSTNTLDWYLDPGGLTAHNGTLWAMDKSYTASSEMLWKFSDNRVTGLAKIPTTDIGYIYPDGIAAINANTLVVAQKVSYEAEIKLFYIDVSGF